MEEFFESEVKLYVPDAWINTSVRDEKDGEVGKVGYEINFNRYFYKYVPPSSPWQKSHGVARQGSVVAGQARGGVDARASATTSNAAQRPQTPGALWVAEAWARLRCNASSTMTRHRLDRRALHPDPRRSQRDPRDFCHGLLDR